MSEVDFPVPNVSRETWDRLHRISELVVAENDRQNLIATSTIDSIWPRHIVDSAQLLPLAPDAASWCDIGSGAGFPGLVIAALRPTMPMQLVEPRRLRAEFLEKAVKELGLTNVQVAGAKAQAVAGRYDIISARAVAATGKILDWTRHLAHTGTRYLLLKGRSAKTELDEARRTWQGSFSLVPSLTDEESSILVIDGAKPRGKR